MLRKLPKKREIVEEDDVDVDVEEVVVAEVEERKIVEEDDVDVDVEEVVVAEVEERKIVEEDDVDVDVEEVVVAEVEERKIVEDDDVDVDVEEVVVAEVEARKIVKDDDVDVDVEKWLVAETEERKIVEDVIDVDFNVEEVVVAKASKIVEEDTVDFEKVAGVSAAEEKNISEENSIAFVDEEKIQEAAEEKDIAEEDNIAVDVEEVAIEQKRKTVYPPCNCKAIECFSKIPEHDRLIINRSYWEKTNTQRKQWVYDHITRSAPKRRYSEDGASKRQYNTCIFITGAIETCGRENKRKVMFLSTLGYSMKNDKIVTSAFQRKYYC